MRVILFVSFYSMVLSSSPSSANPIEISTDSGVVTAYNRSKALVIANSQYALSTEWVELTAVPSQSIKVAEALKNQGFEVEVAPDLDHDKLEDRIKKFLLTDTLYDDRLLVYFAGHGWSDADSTGYLVPTDAFGLNNPNYVTRLTSMDSIKFWADKSGAKHVLFVFDSCFSGAVFLTRNNIRPSTLFIEDALRRTRQFITSGSENQKVPAKGVFADKFVEAFEGAADVVPDGVITANELGYWLKSVITPLGAQTPQFGAAPSNINVPGDRSGHRFSAREDES